MHEAGLHFAQPLWLWGLLAIPLVIAWLMLSSPFRQRGQEDKYADAHLLAYLSGVATTRVVSSRKPLLGWALAWGLLSLAMAGPRWDFQQINPFEPGADLVILLDISRSMDVTDVNPSRLERARQEIQDLVNANPGVGIGLIAFASVAHVITPVTEDRESLLDDATVVIPTALLYLGYPANSIDPDHLSEVESLLRAIRPFIRYFSNTKMLLDLPSEEVCIAMSWSGDYSVATARAAEAGLDLERAYSVPEEGIPDWYDMMYIPADAQHLDAAYLFLDFILRPDVIARISNFTGYANANVAATSLVDPAISADLAIYPDDTIMQRLHSVKMLPPKLERIRSRSWIKIKTGL